MPSWLLLALSIAGCIAVTGLLAAGATGRWSTFWRACREFSLVLAVLAIPAVLVLVWLFIVAP